MLVSEDEVRETDNRNPGRERKAHLVDGDPCNGAFQHLGHERQVLKDGVVVIEVQEIHKHGGTAGGFQRGPAAWDGRGDREVERGEGKRGAGEKGPGRR